MFPGFDAAILATSLWMAADGPPTFNVEKNCGTIASRVASAAEFEACMSLERSARDQLVKEWAQFAPADRSHCLQLSTLGGDPTYTELLTCLELERDARKLREEKERGAARQGQR